jgi:hypothetical protein
LIEHGAKDGFKFPPSLRRYAKVHHILRTDGLPRRLHTACQTRNPLHAESLTATRLLPYSEVGLSLHHHCVAETAEAIR